MTHQHPIDQNDPRHPVVREIAQSARDLLRFAVAADIADPSNLDGLDELDELAALDAQHAEGGEVGAPGR